MISQTVREYRYREAWLFSDHGLLTEQTGFAIIE